MTSRTLMYWAAIFVIYVVLAFALNGLFFGQFTITTKQLVIGFLIGFFMGAALDLFTQALEEGHA